MEHIIQDEEILARNWGAVLLRGAVGVLFGLTTFLVPGLTVSALVLLFGAFAMADGILAIVSAVRDRTGNAPRSAIVLRGLFGVAAGIVTMFWPGITVIALLYVIAAWAIVGGVFEIAAAVRLRKAIRGEWLLALSGVVSVGLGLALMLFPGPGALALVLWIGAYALVFGAVLIVLALRLRDWQQHGRGEMPRALGQVGQGGEPLSHP
jgi:uncharacterized membrane protein HdeD (DUF308 family)